MAETWIDRIAAAAREDSLVLLIGAGASMNPPRRLPSWGQLLRLMADHARGFQSARADLILDELAAGNYLGAAEYYSQDDRVPKNERQRFFREQFDTLPADVPDVYRILGQVPARHRVTTNFDNHLAQVAGPDVQTISQHELRVALSLWWEKRFAVYLHGRAWNYDSLVYSRSTYARLQADGPYREFIKRMFLESSVLAFGYSFSDPDMNSILGFIGNELGGATERTHVLLTPDGAAPPEDLLRRANFEVVRYDPAKDHAQASTLLRDLLRTTGASTAGASAPQVPVSREVSALVGLCASILTSDRDSTYASACAAIVLGILVAKNGPTAESSLPGEVSHVAHVSLAAASAMVRAGLAELDRQGLVSSVGGTITARPHAPAPTGDLDAVVEAIEVRFKTYKFDYQPDDKMRRAIRRALTHVIVAQGMAVARAFANEDEPSSYVLPLLVGEAMAEARIPNGIRDELGKAMLEIVAQPTPEQSRAFFRLAHAAYALETVFLNPTGSSAGEILSWRFYLDSNVALRTISPTSQQFRSFGKLLGRLKDLNASLFLLYPFLQEMATHVGRVGKGLKAQNIKKLEELTHYLDLVPAEERSPILEWYVASSVKAGYSSFEQFCKDRGLDSEAAIEALLKRQCGITVDGRDARRRHDTSTRETLWDALRRWHGQGQKSQPARMLRRNEATQIVWLVSLREAGVRSWFLSIDGQLRQALKFYDKAQYSGFVMTPTAWAHKLAEVHWGEIDMAGFSEMMWVLPPRTVRERLQQLTIRQVIERSDDPESINIEQLRDQVEDWFSKGPVDIAIRGAEVAEEDGERATNSGNGAEPVFEDLVSQVVPKTVAAILDDLARKKIRRGK